MRGSDTALEELAVCLPLRAGGEIPLLVCFYPDLIYKDSPCVFLSNGFSANQKTWTFRPLFGSNTFGMSIMEYLALQGFVVVVKNIGNERTALEPDFGSHSDHVEELASGVAALVPKVIGEQKGRKFHSLAGIHWVGHSLGGMEVMPVKNRHKILSFTAIASPTYMSAGDLSTRIAAVILWRVIGLHRRQLRENLPINHFGRLANGFFDALNIRSGSSLTHDQKLLISLLMHLPGFHTISHIFLNLDHLDLETTVAFFRSALSDETVYLMVEFAGHVLRGERGRGEVIGREIVPFEMPTLVIAGAGDNIAPPQSCEDLIQYVKHPHRYAFTFEAYDHVGLLARGTAKSEIWPIIAVFIHESNAVGTGGAGALKKSIKEVQRIAKDETLGHKARGFTCDSLRRLKNIRKMEESITI